MACAFRFVAAALAAAAWSPVAEGALRGALDGGNVNFFLKELEFALTTDVAEMPQAVREGAAEHVEHMRPVFAALPKSEDGYLDASAARYLSHRYFIDRRGWFVPASGRNEAADETLPELLLGMTGAAASFRARLAKRGLSLLEVAAMAAALEALASLETSERLRDAYRIVGVPPSGPVSEDQIKQIMLVYVASYAMGLDFSTFTSAEVHDLLEDIHTPVPNWDPLVAWSHKLRAKELAAAPELRYSFEGLIKVFDSFQNQYAHWSNSECFSVKVHLMHYVTPPGTGRVPLATFRGLSLPGGWVSEDVEKLRETGALDESNPAQPSVVIANYFETPDNCADPSQYYSVCCISECEALMTHLELGLGSPNAQPRSIIEIVEVLPSSTVGAPRTLPPLLKQRLDSIAQLHGGHVKLHSRLFRQWLHHAYPSECTFPSLANEAALASPARAALAATASAPASPGNATARAAGPGEQEIPWFDNDEDYLTCQGPTKAGEVPAASARLSLGVSFRAVFSLAIVVGLVLMLVQEGKALRLKRVACMGGCTRDAKQFV